MTYNHKKASEDKYPLQVNGKMLQLNSGQMAHLIKKRMREDRAVQKLFEKFEVDLDQLENLNIEIGDLSGRYAETDIDGTVLDKNLFDGGQFFSKNYFVCVHELAHYLSRHKENIAYFNDPEEVLGFVGSVASLLASGSDLDEIFTLVYPRISFHFHNEEDSREFMAHCIYKAKELLG
ncbi:hypothetical protein LCGC14_1658550 [marine sediment metagenome]|uniref:Uncharacterized protein n=1 Tax=marine sediment metagenome TaxID=412755 RepID=A0A0F9IHA3_9ZZZZ